MENEEQNDFRLEGTGFAYTLSLIAYCEAKRPDLRSKTVAFRF